MLQFPALSSQSVLEHKYLSVLYWDMCCRAPLSATHMSYIHTHIYCIAHSLFLPRLLLLLRLLLIYRPPFVGRLGQSEVRHFNSNSTAANCKSQMRQEQGSGAHSKWQFLFWRCPACFLFFFVFVFVAAPVLACFCQLALSTWDTEQLQRGGRYGA